MSAGDTPKIKSLSEFIAKASSYIRDCDTDTTPLFRGHADSAWKWLPSIARPPYEPRHACITEQQQPAPLEYRFLVRFRDMIIPCQPSWIHAPTTEEQEWRQLVLARHYGLPTRLLDWTTMPMVALFFAVVDEDYWDKDGLVGAMHTDNKTMFTVTALARNNKHPPFYKYDSEHIGFFIPPDIDQRVTRQGSVFSIRQDPWAPAAAQKLCIVPAGQKQQLLQELRFHGITHASLFPGLSSVARTLKEDAQDWD